MLNFKLIFLLDNKGLITSMKNMLQNTVFIQNFISFPIILFIILLPLLVTFCSKESTPPEDFVFPDSNLSFQKHIHTQIFIPHCASPGCHSTIDRASSLDLETRTPTFTSDNGLVVIESYPEQSRLYLVLLNPIPPDILRMPKGRAPLSNDMISAIQTWIREGANIQN